MSVWKKLESKILESNVDRGLLEQSLNEMGIGLDFNTTTIRNGYGTDTVDAAFVNLRDNQTKSIGIAFTQKGGIELRGDIWATGFGVDGKQEALLDKIAQTYQKNNIVKVVENNGWTIESTKEVNGKIELELYQL